MRGSTTECRKCGNSRRVRAWKAANPERARAINTQPTAEQKRRYVTSEKGRAVCRAKSQRYQRRAGAARVSWRHQPLIDDLYALASIYRAAGHDAHVDHIYPLAGKTVCGLHVEQNLTVIPALQNKVKKNRLPPEVTT